MIAEPKMKQPSESDMAEAIAYAKEQLEKLTDVTNGQRRKRMKKHWIADFLRAKGLNPQQVLSPILPKTPVKDR